ncbi:MAG: hypothetical protein KBT21_10820 [Treponema sp.]|nr:hypothetical protein [Candidatus Treponema merdequi]
MKKFLIRIFILIFLISSSVIILNAIKKPTVRCITNSLSLDAKLYDIREHNFSRVKNIALGSSMTLNNINAEVFVTKLQLKDFYNFSAWGLTICDVLNLFKIYNRLYSPEKLFVFSNTMDFATDGPTIADLKLKLINAYLKPGLSLFDIPVELFYSYPFCKDNISQYEGSKNDSKKYESLKYDFSGSVPLEVYGDNKREARVNRHISQYVPTEFQYQKLDELCKFCKENKIQLYFIQTPFSSKYLTDEKGGGDLYIVHTNRCESICNKNNATYVNINDFLDLNDEDFADSSHLNVKNSKIFTDALIQSLSELNKE